MAEGATTAVNGKGIASTAVDVAATMAGKAYAWGGKTTDGFDCSGFVSHVLNQVFPNASYGGDVASYMATTTWPRPTASRAT